MRGFITNPREIEDKSMRMISEILGEKTFPADEEKIIKRIIHTTADFEYADITIISKNAVESAKKALLAGNCKIVSDTQMIVSGVNKRILKALNGSIDCYVDREEIANIANEQGVTRSMANIMHASDFNKEGIYMIGNAPTALYEVIRLIKEGKIKPSLVIGVPVGFVEAAESKDALMEMDVPYISTKGRKGGSTVAVAILNAILLMVNESV